MKARMLKKHGNRNRELWSFLNSYCMTVTKQLEIIDCRADLDFLEGGGGGCEFSKNFEHFVYFLIQPN